MQEIISSNSSKHIRELGRKIKGFDQTIWDSAKYDIVKRGVYLKFTTHNDLKNILLKTGDNIIAEAAWYDRIWGIGISVEDAYSGKPWRGENLLGKILMDVRDELSQQ